MTEAEWAKYYDGEPDVSSPQFPKQAARAVRLWVYEHDEYGSIPAPVALALGFLCGLPYRKKVEDALAEDGP